MEMMSEFIVIEGCPFVGMKLEELVKKYEVKVLHFHNPDIDSELELKYDPKREIQKYFSIQVSGVDENVRRLRLDSVNYKNN